MRRLNSFPSRQSQSSPAGRMPHLAAMARAVFRLSPVTIRTVMPARWHLRMASGTCGHPGAVRDPRETPRPVPPASARPSAAPRCVPPAPAASPNPRVLRVFPVPLTSGRTGSSMPTTAMQVSSPTMAASSSQGGSGTGGKSRKARTKVRSPAAAIGSTTFRTTSSRSRGPKARASPPTPRMAQHLRAPRREGGPWGARRTGSGVPRASPSPRDGGPGVGALSAAEGSRGGGSPERPHPRCVPREVFGAQPPPRLTCAGGFRKRPCCRGGSRRRAGG